MKLHTLKPANGSVKSSKRIGRGPGSGMGGTSTRGHKGAKSRSGYKSKIGFEGGQMPLQRRIPKFGFKSLNRVEFKPVNLDTLAELISTFGLSSVNPENLFEHGLISKNDLIKVLSRGDVKVGVEVKAHAFSASAVQAIESAGGKAIVIE